MKYCCPVCEFPQLKGTVCSHHACEVQPVREVRLANKIADIMEAESVAESIESSKRFGVAPYAVNDHLTPHMDYSLGHVVQSKAARRDEYAARGLNMSSPAEMRRLHPTNSPAKNRVINYQNMKVRRSSAEKRITPVE